MKSCGFSSDFIVEFSTMWSFIGLFCGVSCGVFCEVLILLGFRPVGMLDAEKHIFAREMLKMLQNKMIVCFSNARNQKSACIFTGTFENKITIPGV